MTSRAWTGAEAHALRLALGFSIEEFAAALDVAPRTVAYWSSRPDSEPRHAIQELLDRLQRSHMETQRQASSSELGEPDMVLEETERFLAEATQVMVAVGDDGIELLTHGVRGLAQTYNTRPLLSEFQAAASLQRRSINLLTQTSRPSELTDLYVTIAQLGALMASCAFDLGRSEQAHRLTTASLLYADRGGDSSLTAWILGLRASLDLWMSRSSKALESIERGLLVAPAGQPRFRLRHIGARAAAAAGDETRAIELLHLADEEQYDQRQNRLANEMGGEFHFDDGRAAACASATWLRLRRWDQVAASTQQAIDYYSVARGTSRVPMLGARLDLATALVHSGDIDAAGQQLELAFAEAAEHRYSLVARVGQLKSLLERRRSERQANTLHETASDWLAGAAP